MATNYKKELRSFFDKLIQLENSYKQSFEDTPSYSYYSDIMGAFSAPDLRVQALKSMAASPSFSEAFVLDAIYKMESMERDAHLRGKARLQYISEAYSESAMEIQRLDMSKFNSLQFALGNADIQKKTDA